MQPTSASQYEAAEAGIVPGLEQVRDDVWALGIAMPGGHVRFSLMYLLRDSDGRLHVIDPGWDSDENWSIVVAALASLPATVTDIRTITATHLHPDHIGMADRLRRASGAPLLVHGLEQEALSPQSKQGWPALAPPSAIADWGIPDDRQAELQRMADETPARGPIVADRALTDDETLSIPGFDITAMRTPGHTAGHICLRDDRRRIMFSGDHVLPTMHAGLGLGGATDSNPLADYLDSLERVSAYPDYEVLPGHGYRFHGIVERATQSAEHHLRRSREVAAVIAEGGNPPVWAIATRLTWTAGWANLTGFYLYSALAQTSMHRDYVEHWMAE